MPADFKVAGTSATVACAAAAGVFVPAAFAAPWSIIRTIHCELRNAMAQSTRRDASSRGTNAEVALLDPSCVVYTVQVTCTATASEHSDVYSQQVLAYKEDNDFDT